MRLGETKIFYKNCPVVFEKCRNWYYLKSQKYTLGAMQKLSGFVENVSNVKTHQLKIKVVNRYYLKAILRK